MNNFMNSIKKATKGVVDSGAKQMLRADIVFLDREIKTRKQTFGIEIYDLMDELENDDQLPAADKETKIRSVFDAARKDIAVIQAKKDCKKEEMAVLDAESASSSVAIVVVITNTHPSET